MLQDWFSQDKQLISLKESCEFQVYTAGNPIYKTRYADIVPAEQFPVVLFKMRLADTFMPQAEP